jgi:hypothetical protein
LPGQQSNGFDMQEPIDYAASPLFDGMFFNWYINPKLYLSCDPAVTDSPVSPSSPTPSTSPPSPTTLTPASPDSVTYHPTMNSMPSTTLLINLLTFFQPNHVMNMEIFLTRTNHLVILNPLVQLIGLRLSPDFNSKQPNFYFNGHKCWPLILTLY